MSSFLKILVMIKLEFSIFKNVVISLFNAHLKQNNVCEVQQNTQRPHEQHHSLHMLKTHLKRMNKDWIFWKIIM